MGWLSALLAFALLAGACGGGDGGQAPTAVDTATPDDAGESTEPDNAEGPDDQPESPESEDDDDGLIAPVIETTTTSPAGEGDGVGEPEPQFGGTLRVAVEAEADSLSPSDGSFAVSAYLMALPIFDPAVGYAVDGKWFPYLAESLTPIGDGSVWQMKVREGVRFHDGTPLDADDVVATFEAQLRDFEISLAVTPVFVDDPNERMAKIDDLTVEFRLSRPFAQFPASLTSQLGMVQPSEWLEQAAADPSMHQMPVGTGPFMIESRDLGHKTVLVRNPDYWAKDLTDVYLDRIEFYVNPETATAAEQLVAGDLDMLITTDTSATLTLQEAQEREEGVYTIENPFSSESFSLINADQDNPDGKPPFNDIRARQALTFATDRDAYVEFIRQGTAIAADTMFHPRLYWHNPHVKQETNMPEWAGPLVDAYCADFPENCSDGKIKMTLSYASGSAEGDLIKDLLIDSWKEFFDVDEDPVAQAAFISQVIVGNYQVANWRHFGAVEPDVDVLWLSCESISPPSLPAFSLNFPRSCDPERDELMYEQRAINDRERRKELWFEIQQRIRDAYVYIFYNHTNWVIGVRDNVHNVCGQTAPADGTLLFCNDQGRAQLHQVWLS